MEKKFLITFSIFLILFLNIIGCKASTIEGAKPVELTIEEKVKQTMDNMSLDEKIAQMLVLYYTNDEVDTNLTNILKTINPGGFILMKDNITTYEKTKQFVLDLQSNSKIPMIISIDQEGGSVQRLKNLSDVSVLDIPYMYDLGKTNDLDLAYQVGTVLAEQLKTIGVNVVYAPTLDVYSNLNNKVIGKRSFGNDPQLVAQMALKLAEALEDNDIIATYKHFPGHGDTATDSHYDLPIVDKNYDELQKLELIPFQRAIENGAKIIMIGHLALPDITHNDIPASLSKEIITDILINDMGYEGLVITDALNMGALTKNYSDEEIYTMAVNAGVDLLLMPNGSQKTIEYIKKNISEERIDISVKKILTFKYTYLNNYDLLDKSYLNNTNQQAIIRQIFNH